MGKNIFIEFPDWDTEITSNNCTVRYKKGTKSKEVKEAIALIEKNKKLEAELKTIKSERELLLEESNKEVQEYKDYLNSALEEIMGYYTDDMQGMSIDERKHLVEKRTQEMKSHYEDDIFESACVKRNGTAWVPLIIGGIITIIMFAADMWIGAVLVLLLSLLITGITLTVASKRNLNDSKYYNLSEASSNRIKKERANYVGGVAGLTGGTISTIHHAKKAGKELLDVDSWKAMK